MMPRGISAGLDAETTERLMRSFLAVRIVRGTLLLVFLVIALVGVEANQWPTGVAAAVALTLLLQAAVLAANCRHYARIARRLRRSAP